MTPPLSEAAACTSTLDMQCRHGKAVMGRHAVMQGHRSTIRSFGGRIGRIYAYDTVSVEYGANTAACKVVTKHACR